MKAIQPASLGILFAALLIAACGDDVTKVTNETAGMEVVASADSLGTCGSENAGKTVFVSGESSAYICADSAWKNVSAAEKVSCSAETLADSSGFKIVCGGDSIGVVRNGTDGKNGKDGADGKDGQTGEKGDAGENCELSDNGDGTISVVCGADSVNLYKAFCDGKLFNPDSSFCFSDSVVPLCGGKAYDLSASFCFADSVVSLCGGKLFNPDSSFCFSDSVVPLCGGKAYDLSAGFCFADSVVQLCGGKTYDLDSNFCSSGLVVPQSKKLVWNLMNPEIEYELFMDARDGQVYRSVQIGEQTWMAENLNYVTDGGYCYNDSLEYCQKYGRLYNWQAGQSACPDGWHLPDSNEFAMLVDKVGNEYIAGMMLKSKAGWDSIYGYLGLTDGNGLDDYGFSALPAGEHYCSRPDFDGIGEKASFRATSNNSFVNPYFSIGYAHEGQGGQRDKMFSPCFAISIRCLKN